MSKTAATAAPTIKLTATRKGWVKKIGGRVRWLAPLDKPDTAMERCLRYMAEHAAVAVSRPATDAVLLSDVCDLFLARKEDDKRTGKIKPRTFAEYFTAVQDCSDFFGANAIIANIAPGDWGRYRQSIAARFADPYSQQRRMVAVRMMSRWAARNEHIARPFRFGDEFNPPSAKVMRAAKKSAGKRLFTAAEVKKILKKAPQPLHCMFLLSLNAGFGNNDVSSLPVSAIQLKKRLLEFDRPKTGVDRRCVLWPETIKSLRQVLAARNGSESPLLFLTPKGHPFVRENYNDNGTLKSNTDAVGVNFGKLLRVLKIPRTFYDGRRTFRTIADELRDDRAVDLIMGHTPEGGDMGSRYVQEISIDRLKAVSDHVRRSLLGAAPRTGAARPGGSATAAAAKRRKPGSRR